MKIYQIIKLAIKNIRNNKLRSALTMLGIIIGISSVIVLVALGSGSTKSITSQVQSLGTNLITVSINRNVNKQVTISTIDDIRTLSGVADIAPTISAGVTVKENRYSEDAAATGTTKGFLDIRGMKLSSGRFLSDLDIELRQNVAVLGSAIAQRLFGFANPIGGSIQLNGSTYQVVGRLQSQGNSLGSNTDDMIIIPVTKAEELAENKNISLMYIRASDDNAVDSVVNEVDSYFNNYFRSNTQTHTVMSQKQLLQTMSSITGTLTLLLGGIAAISLIVGGIGVMNVMLVSVTERTKEIGIRKALGGKRRDILTQFLTEALVLSSLGGICGIAFGVGMAIFLSALGLPAAYSLSIILVSFFFSLAVGIIFGIFPAYKASKLSPIDALRYE